MQVLRYRILFDRKAVRGPVDTMKVVGTLALTVLVGLLQAEINPKVCLPAVEVPRK